MPKYLVQASIPLSRGAPAGGPDPGRRDGEPVVVLPVLDRGLHLGRDLGGDLREPVSGLRVLLGLGHDLGGVLPFEDRAASGHQITAAENLSHRAPPWWAGYGFWMRPDSIADA